MLQGKQVNWIPKCDLSLSKGRQDTQTISCLAEHRLKGAATTKVNKKKTAGILTDLSMLNVS